MRELPDLSGLVHPGATFVVRAVPGARRAAITVGEGVLRIAVTAPPEDGRANAAIRTLLAKALGIAPSRLVLVRGEGTRDKLYRIAG